MTITSKQWIFALLAAGGIALAAWQGRAAVDDWQHWQETQVSDRSAAELYEVNFWFDIGLISVGLISVAGCTIVARR